MPNIKTTVVRLARILGMHVLLIACWVYLVEEVLQLRDFDSGIEDGLKKSPLVLMFFAVLIAPLWEEIVFRLPLKRSKHMWVAVLLGLLFFFGLEFLVFKILTVAYLLLVCLNWFGENLYLKYGVIAISVILFGLIHIENYETADIMKMNGLEFIAAFFSQLVLGGVLTYIRMNYSFKYGLMYHSAFNGILIALALISGIE